MSTLQKNNNEQQNSTSSNELELLTSLLQEFATTLDINRVFEHATSMIKNYLDAEGASLFLLDNNDTELVCRVCASDADITGIRVKSDQGIIGRTIREDATQIVVDVSKDPDFFGGVDKKSGSTTRSILSAPLRVKDQKFGALQAINKRSGTGHFDDNDKNLLTVLANAAALAIYNAQLLEDRFEQERTRKELELARKIQAALLPSHIENHNIYGINIPARKLSGDFYDYLQLGDGSILFCLGDVAGKGANAALLMSKASSLFRCVGKHSSSPSTLMSTINDEIHEKITHGLFITMVVGLYDPEVNQVTMVNAGHQPPLFMHKEHGIQRLDSVSPPVGIMSGMQYEEFTLSLDKGALYLFTDGLTECWEAHDKLLGEEGVKRVLTRFANHPPGQRLNQIVEHVTRWKMKSSGYLFDDITMLLLESPEAV